ncbi:MAG: histidine kinase [Bacillota bacterium]|jgi:signal transduction histidine kinase|nr:histidine kinase [Bacillota bacterium]
MTTIKGKGDSPLMILINYFKERWLYYLFLTFFFLFSFFVYRFDRRFYMTESNAIYILAGWVLLLVLFFAVDMLMLHASEEKFRTYCNQTPDADPEEIFFRPGDRNKAELVRNASIEYRTYKVESDARAAEEMAFITKWLHDVKVPIAAAKLILERHEEKLPRDFQRNMDRELFALEESVMRVFYEMKSNRFSEDYKIVRTGTKKLISMALKSYSSFFQYKQLSLSVEGEDYTVLTDEKWSTYILSQLISNAVKYSPEGGSVVISTVKKQGEVFLSVKNSGKGISEEDLGQIFKKGYTSAEARSGAKATGYGLYLSAKLSGLLGHSLKAESKYGEYAMFHLIFPEIDSSLDMTKM